MGHRVGGGVLEGGVGETRLLTFIIMSSGD